ncbi:hypothetical protein U5N28_00790 [Lysinibacillus telephonicus]|uniref:Uncharacterized protein n=1 Tax=Lysinibacillus telephonicus TaxID=1714840 RepID=A0A3S0HGL3_9BACI|nr:hypothetical protein [Lysinibacillus telephonicus]RTQ88723.1 hypothetical protein EKG35_17485 [Lysinibacillus telephonicus]
MNEIKRQLQLKVGDTTQQQQNVIQKISAQYPIRTKKNNAFFPAFISFALLVGACLFVFSYIGEKQSRTPPNEIVATTVEQEKDNENNTTLLLTEEQKKEYYKQYKEIMDKVNEKKLGLGLEVAPMESFEESDWVEPKDYEKMVNSIVEDFLATEREKKAALSRYLEETVTNLDGETTKPIYVYFSGLMIKIKMTANFVTQYNAEYDRQLFIAVNDISTQLADKKGTWEQTSSKASLIDGGKTYSIRIEGIFYFNGITYEKAFTIEFSCDEFGNIY